MSSNHVSSPSNLISPRPDHPGQAALDPGTAAQIWRDNMEPLKNIGYRLVSPAVTSAASGKVWLQNFIGSCPTCHVSLFPNPIIQALKSIFSSWMSLLSIGMALTLKHSSLTFETSIPHSTRTSGSLNLLARFVFLLATSIPLIKQVP